MGSCSSGPRQEDSVTEVPDLFPVVRDNYAAELVSENDDDVNVNPVYPRRKAQPVPTSATTSSALLEPVGEPVGGEEEDDTFDYGKLRKAGGKAAEQALYLLMDDFRTLCRHDIKWALGALKGHYALTRKALSEALKNKKRQDDSTGNPAPRKRRRRRSGRNSSERRGDFVDFHFQHGSVKLDRRMYLRTKERRQQGGTGTLEASVQRELRQWEEYEGRQLALALNEDEHKQDCQLIECGCCFGEFAFEEMTQCLDGHLFCTECLVRYAQEAVFGCGRSELSCMAAGCTCSYPTHQLDKALPENVLRKYHERQAEEAVAAACGEDLVHCPSCDFPALLDEDEDVFRCPNPRCFKASCRKCRAPWDDDAQHAGKTCEQVAEADEVRTRVRFEESMTEAWVRKCAKCGAAMVKADGCNRMTCRCGGRMCYVCRAQISERARYGHFCGCESKYAAAVVGGVCGRCDKCSLLASVRRHDKRVIKELQKEGEAELSKKSPQNTRKRVGAPLVLKGRKKNARRK